MGEPRGTAAESARVRAGSAPALPARLKIFSYAVEPKAPIYRSAVAVFAEAKERYVLRLRPAEVLERLPEAARVRLDSEAGIDRELDQLVEWGTLKRIQDTSRARNLAEFLRRRSLYQLTPEGEAAHKAVEKVEAALGSAGSLQGFMLPAVLDDLRDLAARAEAPKLDGGALNASLLGLFAKFDSLTDSASLFMSTLTDAIEAGDLADESFRVYKGAVIAYLDRFLSELTGLAPAIVETIARIEGAGIGSVIAAAAEADEAPAPPGVVADPEGALKVRWEGLCAWFVGARRAEPTLEALRAAGLEAINRVLAIAERVNERRFRRVNRTADLLQLARWFEASQDEDAHHLFALSFALFSSRHLLTEAEDEDACRGASWWDAPPVEVSARLRSSARGTRTGTVAAIEDLSESKDLAAQRLRAEQAAYRRAVERFAGQRTRLSELGTLDMGELMALLELLGRALAGPPGPDGHRTTSADGTLGIHLSLPGDGAIAEIVTAHGILRCPDYALAVAQGRAAEAMA